MKKITGFQLTEIPINRTDAPGRFQSKGRKQPKKTNTFFKLLKNLSAVGVVLICIMTGAMTYYALPAVEQYKTLTLLTDRILGGKYNQLCTSAYSLKTGTDLEAAKLIERLNELGYSRHSSKECQPGYFFVDGGLFYLTLQNKTKNIPRRFVLELDGAVIQRIVDLENNREFASISLPPSTLTWFLDRIWEIRVPKTYDQFPPDLINAVLATEDQKYFQHPGVDTMGIIRAAWVNFRAGKVVQGGSTITQQMVKVLLKRQDRSIGKKYEEAILALALEQKYSKEELLTIYLNNVYLGTAAPFEIRGMAAAANYILGKDIEELNIEDCAMLGGLVRSPNSASPIRNPKAAAKRTKTVIHQMARLGDPLAAKIKIGSHLKRFRHQKLLHQQSWFFAQLEKELKQRRFLPAAPAEGQLIVHTTLDPWFQATAYKAVQQQLEELEKKKKMKNGTLQGALVLADPRTGGVRAIVGGRDFLKSPFNRAVSARRQIGSLIKPFIYLSALGGSDVQGHITQATIIEDKPMQIDLGGSVWKPGNYDRKFQGSMTVRQALAKSRNIPAITVGRQVGLEKFVSLVQLLGINNSPSRYPALFLGACESTPLRMAAAFSVIANGGKMVTPHFFSSIFQGEEEIWKIGKPTPILAPGPCFVLTEMLQEVMISGTGRKSKKMGFMQVAAGKTGTTNKLRDAWFAGYTPSLVTVSWVGRDNNNPCKLTGSTGALPLWTAAMKTILGKSQTEEFSPPASVEFATIDSNDGKLATNSTKIGVKMAFIRGTVPQQYSQHQESELLALRKELHMKKVKKVKKIRKQLHSRQEEGSWLVSQLKRTAEWFR